MCNCTKKKLSPSGSRGVKKVIKKTSRPLRASVRPTRRIVRRTTR